MFIVDYLSSNWFLVLVIILQVICFLIPVSFINWDVDIINAITFVAVQVFICLVLFCLIPWALGISPPIPLEHLCFIVGITVILGVVRIIYLIPLEGAKIVLQKTEKRDQIDFTSMMTPQKLKLIAAVDPRHPRSWQRVAQIRESLYKTKPDYEDSLDLSLEI